MTDEEFELKYKEEIAKNCTLSYSEHLGMLGCWGMINSIQEGHELNCGSCEFRKLNSIRTLT